MTISNILIILSVIFTLASFIKPELLQFWVNNYFLQQWNYLIYFCQFFIWEFLHWWMLHLIMNSFFIYYFWNIVEHFLWRKRFLAFFIFSSIFIWFLLTILTDKNHIWISGFAMALLAYYTLELKSKKNPEYKAGILAIIINVAIWINPEISWQWHLFWAISWIIFYLLNKDFFSRSKVWFIKIS